MHFMTLKRGQACKFSVMKRLFLWVPVCIDLEIFFRAGTILKMSWLIFMLHIPSMLGQLMILQQDLKQCPWPLHLPMAVVNNATSDTLSLHGNSAMVRDKVYHRWKTLRARQKHVTMFWQTCCKNIKMDLNKKGRRWRRDKNGKTIKSFICVSEGLVSLSPCVFRYVQFANYSCTPQLITQVDVEILTDKEEVSHHHHQTFFRFCTCISLVWLPKKHRSWM